MGIIPICLLPELASNSQQSPKKTIDTGFESGPGGSRGRKTCASWRSAIRARGRNNATQKRPFVNQIGAILIDKGPCSKLIEIYIKL
jgi:hypothetical protein